MQRYNLEVIEHRHWRVPVEAESDAEAIEKVKHEQGVKEAYLVDTHIEVISCNTDEK